MGPVGWGGVGIGYLRPDQFLDHLTVITKIIRLNQHLAVPLPHFERSSPALFAWRPGKTRVKVSRAVFSSSTNYKCAVWQKRGTVTRLYLWKVWDGAGFAGRLGEQLNTGEASVLITTNQHLSWLISMVKGNSLRFP